MIQYTLNNINAAQDFNKYKISHDIINIIEHYTKLVSSPNYNKTPHFLMKKSLILNNNRDRIIIIQDSIKKILNKITSKTYDKLIIELITLIKLLISENIDNDKNIMKTTFTQILDILFLSNINTELNINLCYKLIDEYPFFKEYIDDFIENIKDLYKEIKIYESINYEELERTQKNNNIIKNKIIFFCNLEKFNKLDGERVNECIIQYQNILYNKLNIDNNKIECDELAEIILIFLNNKLEYDINNCNDNIIVKNIKNIIDSKVSIVKNLSMKIILKHKNIISKFNL